MNPRKHKPELLNFTTKALAHFKHMVSMQGKENKVKLGVANFLARVPQLSADPNNPWIIRSGFPSPIFLKCSFIFLILLNTYLQYFPFHNLEHQQ